MATDEMLEKISAKVKVLLQDLKVVCYYGCMASRPPLMTDAGDCENPQSMDRILRTWACKSSPGLIKPTAAARALRSHVRTWFTNWWANFMTWRSGLAAQAVVVSCQMCQANLDLYQEKIETVWGRKFALPIIYFTELIGLACGLPGVKTSMRAILSTPCRCCATSNWSRSVCYAPPSCRRSRPAVSCTKG